MKNCTIPKSGAIIPDMGIIMNINETQHTTTRVADALFTQVQQRVLAVLFGNPSRSFYANEVIALVHSGTGAVQRELKRLVSSGLVTLNRRGNQTHYQANMDTPVYAELRGLVIKTCGLADVVRAALEPLATQIERAFIYGSTAKGEDSANSDIDLMVISPELTYAELFMALEPASLTLGRTINPTVYTSEEFAHRQAEGNAFVLRVLEQAKIEL